MKQHVSLVEWISLSADIRRKLIERFSINKSGPVQVVNNVLVSDGVYEKDLVKMNIGTLAEFLKDDLPWFSEDLCDQLFLMLKNKMYGKPIKEGIIESEEIVTKRRGRPRKEAADLSGSPRLPEGV